MNRYGVPVGATLACPDGPDNGGCANTFEFTAEMDEGDDWVYCPHCGITFAPEQGVKEPV